MAIATPATPARPHPSQRISATAFPARRRPFRTAGADADRHVV
jgi:hypothetical protein